MSTPETPEQTPSPNAIPQEASHQEAAPKDQGAEAIHADTAGEHHAPNDADTSESDHDAGSEGDSPADAAAGDGAAKKRRRRRRKKKGGAETPMLNADGTPMLNEDGTPMMAPAAPHAAASHMAGPDGAERPVGQQAGGQHSGGQQGGSQQGGQQASGQGAEGGKRQKRKREPKPQVERERPPFGVGDIVFGKVIEVTDDILMVDLSGKAKGIFDLRELLIPEEEAKAPFPDDEDDEPVHAAPNTDAAAGEATAGEATAVDASAEAAAPETADTAADDSPKRRIVVAPSLQEKSAEELAAEAAAPETTVAAAPVAAEQPALPRVILETGAQFVGVVHNDGGRGGLVVLTHHPERYKRAKPVVAQAAKDGSQVFGIVTGVIRGGVEVDVDGLRAFVPASHMDLRMGADLQGYIGQRISFAVTQYGKRGRDVVLSRRAELEVESKALREKALATISVGADVDGVVRTVVTFGAFIDIGGIEGLVPLSEMSHNRADQPHDVFKVGETTRVKVQRIDERGKLWLSRRATLPDPWAEIATKYATGTRHTGKIVRLHPAGAFVELEAGIDGLIRRGDLSIKRIEHPSEVVKEGESIDVVVAQMDSQNRRISLFRAPEGEAANEAPQKVILHKSVKVKVVLCEPGGIIVRIMGVSGWLSRGFIPAMATGTPRGTELKKLFPVGKELDVKVLEMDPRKEEVKLSIRAFSEDNERNAYQTYRAQVKREAKFGTFADLLAKRNDKG